MTMYSVSTALTCTSLTAIARKKAIFYIASRLHTPIHLVHSFYNFKSSQLVQFTFLYVHLTTWCACHATHQYILHRFHTIYTVHGKSLHQIGFQYIPAWEFGHRSSQVVLHQPCSLNHEICCACII